jgi:hypothetical protein
MPPPLMDMDEETYSEDNDNFSVVTELDNFVSDDDKYDNAGNTVIN